MNKAHKLSDIILCAVFSAIIVGLGLWVNVKAPDKLSISERRELSSKPEISYSDVSSGKYFKAYEEYLLDQFPMREDFRRVKSFATYYVFGQTDNHGIVMKNGHAVGIETPSEKSVNVFFKRLDSLYENHFESVPGLSVYTTVIPDKMYFLGDDIGYPTIDYASLRQRMATDAPGKYIDIFDMLDIDDYYKTDTHWKEEKITDIADALLVGMGNDKNENLVFSKPYSPFYGVYYGQSALLLDPDEIVSVHSEIIDSASFIRANINSTGFDASAIYDEEKLLSNDAYDFYLGGACTVCQITSELSESGKTLYLFSDSFGRSLAPLLLSGYEKIVICDIRYISPSEIFSRIPLGQNSDVLIAYSMATVDNSTTLRTE